MTEFSHWLTPLVTMHQEKMEKQFSTRYLIGQGYIEDPSVGGLCAEIYPAHRSNRV